MMNLFGDLSSLRCCDQGTSAGTVVQSLAHINPIPLLYKNISKDYAIRHENITIVPYFLLSSCDVVTWKDGRRRVASASEFFLSKLERLPGCGPQH